MKRFFLFLTGGILPLLALTALMLGLAGRPQVVHADPAIYYVAPTGDDGNACTSPAAPCRTVQAAINKASPGDEVRVAAYTYTDTHGVVALITKTVGLRGGWDVDFTLPKPDPQAYPTTLDGQGLSQVVVISGPASSPYISPVVQGFRITNGDATNAPGPLAHRGGGIFVRYADAWLLDNTIWGNRATLTGSGEGGGIFVSGEGGPDDVSVVIWGNRVYSNTASLGDTGSGGGMHLRFAQGQVLDNEVLSNTACSSIGTGGGLYLLAGAVTAIGNLIQGNVAALNGDGNGGGLSFSYGYHRLMDNRILSNTASLGLSANASGGGVDARTPALIQGNTIAHNRAGVGAGVNVGGGLVLLGAAAITVTDNLIAHNVTGPDRGYGGGVAVFAGGSLIENNRILDNVAAESGAGDGGGIYIDTPTITVRSNLVQGNTAGVSGTVRGGGLYIWRYPDMVIQANRFFSNTALQGGGLMLNSVGFRLTNNWIAANQAPTGAGVLLVGDGVNPNTEGVFSHNTIARHDGQGVAVGDYARVTGYNNILADNSVGITLTGHTSATLVHYRTLFWPDAAGSEPGNSPLIGDPAFVDAARGDYHLTSASAAIDAVPNVWHVLDDDIDGQSRPYPAGGYDDIGADEFPPDYLLLLLPDRSGWAQAGAQITYTHRLTNIGRMADQYTLTADLDMAGWSVAVRPTTTGPVFPGVGVNVIVTVSVPASALGNQSVTARITATSQATPALHSAVADTTSIICNAVTTASLDYAPPAPETGQTVWFTATANADASPPMTYTWAFGDGSQGQGESVAHTYAQSDTYTVRLTVTNPCGQAVAEEALTVMGGRRLYLPLVLRNR